MLEISHARLRSRSVVLFAAALLVLCRAAAAPPRTCEACSPRELDHLRGMAPGSQRRAFAAALSAQCLLLLLDQQRPPARVFMNIAMALNDLGEHAAAFDLARGVHDGGGRRDADVALLAASLAKQTGHNGYCASVTEALIQSRLDTTAQTFGLLAACQHRQGNAKAALQTHRLAVQYGAYPSRDPQRPGGAAHWSSRLGKPYPVWERDILRGLGKNGNHIVVLLELLEEKSVIIRAELDAWEKTKAQQHTRSLWVKEHQNLVNVPGHWHELYLYRDGQFEVGAQGACHVHFPRTCDVLQKHKSLFHPAGHVKLSRIAPGSKVWPHAGGTNTKLRGHLGVVVGEHAQARARLNVGGTELGWEAGKAFVFDDTFEHSVDFPARTEGEEGERIVLLFDMFHPTLKKSSRIRMRRKARRLLSEGNKDKEKKKK
jgi:hypothetical protein